jgi:hypothetical protein
MTDTKYMDDNEATTECTHRRQVLVGATEWLCEDCSAVMDANDPTSALT